MTEATAPANEEERKNSHEGEDRHTVSGGEARGAGKETEAEEEKEGSAPPKRPSKKVIVIVALVLLVLGIAGLFYWLHARQFVSTEDAYTTGHVHQVSSRVPGTVAEVWVDDNQLVKRGDLLVVLDPRDFEVSLSRARSALKETEARYKTQQAAIGQSRAGISAAEAQVERTRAGVSQARAELEKARLDYDRVTGLFTRDLKAVSKAEVDAATANLETARSRVEAAQAELAAAMADVDSSRANTEAAETQLGVLQANIGSGEASVRNAELQLSYTKIVAPVDGKISKKTVESGQQIQTGQAVLAVVPDNVWIIANLKETQLENLRVGQRVDVKIDGLPNKTFFGSVHSIQEGTGATFSLLPPDNATGNFTKIVQRVPVKIVFDPDSIRDFRDRIVPGLSVVPHIDLKSLEKSGREEKRAKKQEKQNQEEEEKKNGK